VDEVRRMLRPLAIMKMDIYRLGARERDSQ
jgi:hypothetical protein